MYIVFVNDNRPLYVNKDIDIKRINESIGGIYKRNDNWMIIDGFYINLDNVAYIRTEDN
jgi:hypothetical protein